MRQYTTPEQTAKLIELGFPQPKSEVKAEQAGDYVWYNPTYSIGELIETLPMVIIREMCGGGYKGVWVLRIDTYGAEYAWEVSYERDHTAHLYREGSIELIDALYDMLIKLKEEGVI